MARTVVFRDQTKRGVDSPAIITRVWSLECVNLKVMPDCAQVYDATPQMLIDAEDKTAHGWFWPPRV